MARARRVAFCGKKNTHRESGYRLPTVIRPPGIIDAGRQARRLQRKIIGNTPDADVALLVGDAWAMSGVGSAC